MELTRFNYKVFHLRDSNPRYKKRNWNSVFMFRNLSTQYIICYVYFAQISCYIFFVCNQYSLAFKVKLTTFKFSNKDPTYMLNKFVKIIWNLTYWSGFGAFRREKKISRAILRRKVFYSAIYIYIKKIDILTSLMESKVLRLVFTSDGL